LRGKKKGLITVSFSRGGGRGGTPPFPKKEGTCRGKEILKKGKSLGKIRGLAPNAPLTKRENLER